jgi:outer membrane protein assembly factor BamB
MLLLLVSSSMTVLIGCGTTNLVEASSGADWPMFHHDPARTGVASENITLPLKLAWTYRSPLGGTPTDVIVANGTVYVGYSNGYVYAIDGKTGAYRWNYHTGGAITGSPAYYDGIVLVGNDEKKVYALDATTGLKKWEALLEAVPYGSQGLLVSNYTLVLDTYSYAWPSGGLGASPYVYSIQTTNGQINWRYDIPSAFWDIQNHAPHPALLNGQIVAPTYCGANGYSGVYCIYFENGTLKWKNAPRYYWENNVIPEVYISPTMDGSRVYSAGRGGYVYALDFNDGTLKWQFQTGAAMQSSPGLFNGVIYIGSDNGVFYALNSLDGTKKWQFSRGSNPIYSSPAISNNTVFFMSENKNLYALDANTGQLLWSYPLGGNGGYSPAIGNNGYLYIGCNDGLIYAFTHYNVTYQLTATVSTPNPWVWSSQALPITIDVFNGTQPLSGSVITLDAGGQGSFEVVNDLGNGTYTTVYNAPSISVVTSLTIATTVTHAGPYDDCTVLTPITVYPQRPPGTPTNLIATNGTNALILSWNPPVNNGTQGPVTNYQIYRGTSSGGETFLIEIGNTTTFQDNGVLDSQSYYYRISAKNDFGEGQKSNEVGPVTIPEFPSFLILSLFMITTLIAVIVFKRKRMQYR